LDGNTLPSTCTSAPYDWAGLKTVGGLTPCGSAGFTFVNDGVGSADPTYLSSGGSEDA